MSEDPNQVIIGYKGVKYGLQKPKSRKSVPAAFGGDSSDEDDVEAQVRRQQAKKLKESKLSAEYAAALAEDPTVFDYDGVYDEINERKQEPRLQEKQMRKPKYITALLEKAELRKKEQDIAYERQLLKDRKKEDHLFGDKETFVTSAYRKKLAEDKLWLEKEKQREKLEEQDDVTKRKNLNDFYRNLTASNNGFQLDPDAAPAEPSQMPQSESDRTERIVESRAKQQADREEAGLDEYERLRRDAERRSASKQSTTARDRSVERKEDNAEDGKDGASEAVDRGVQTAGKRRNDDSKINEARERYMARKRRAVG